MQVEFACPVCEHVCRLDVSSQGDGKAATDRLECPACDWGRDLPAEPTDRPKDCLVCGCDDLWRQKDFPHAIGLMLVAVGAVLSTIAWAYHEPVWALGILLAFAAVDLLLFTFVSDVLVCYRCGARYRGVASESDPAYDHELGERYRQEAIRLSEKSPTPPS